MLVVIPMLLTLGVLTQPVNAQTLKVLYRFPIPSQADFGVIRDSSDNLYGTTTFGGANQLGSVFKISKGGTETTVYSFTGGTNGQEPNGGLVRDSAGNFYGAAAGGAFGYGTIFKVTPAGSESVLYSFRNGTDGFGPGSLVRDSSGNLYGAANGGGVSNSGTVFRLSPGGVLTVLYSFTGINGDGANPNSGLARDRAGNLFGTTSSRGASNSGILFKVDRMGNETVLHSFSGGADGGYPNGNVILDSSGNIYGTAEAGGAFGVGIIFKVDSSGNETVLYNFGNSNVDGRNPDGGVYRDSAGNLYGNTTFGGEYNWGTSYKLDTSNNETVLHSFTGGTDGKYPVGPLTGDTLGNLYGTTDQGGSISFSYGVVFRLKP
jgi:uncharacterized repeat protein (TIGR03803 family)